MNDSRDFKKEYDSFLEEVPYQMVCVDGVKTRYQYDGKDDAQSFFFSMD